jgi:hypothetical protein
MNKYAMNLAIWAIQILLSADIVERIRAMVIRLMNDPRQPGETRKMHNDRRRDYVVGAIKEVRSDLRTALLEAAVGLLVAAESK